MRVCSSTSGRCAARMCSCLRRMEAIRRASTNSSRRSASMASLPTFPTWPLRSSGGTRRALDATEEIDERRRRLPLGRRVTNGRGIEIEEADEDLADDARADRAKTVAVAADVSLALDVIPERRVAMPTGRRGTD